MDKTVRLKDDSVLSIRPLERADFAAALAFFRALPEEDRAYLRQDVTDRAVVERIVRQGNEGSVKRLVGMHDDAVVALGVLDLEHHAWKEHVAEIRLIVARSHQRMGLGMCMARELVSLASRERVQELMVKMMRPQEAAQQIFRRLGFAQELVMPHYVVDRRGEKQDLILMRCELEALWQELEHYCEAFDWQRVR